MGKQCLLVTLVAKCLKFFDLAKFIALLTLHLQIAARACNCSRIPTSGTFGFFARFLLGLLSGFLLQAEFGRHSMAVPCGCESHHNQYVVQLSSLLARYVVLRPTF